MLLIPAVDVKDGKCVRLRQGRRDDATVFSDDPVAMAERWVAAGARRLHIVDLNGAFAGRPVNGTVVRDMVAACPDDVPVQVGGGIRDLDTVAAYLEAGVRYAIIGTQAVREPALVAAACARFPGRIVVGLDAYDGKVAVEGWAEVSHFAAAELARRFQGDGVAAVVYTDIRRDGMMSGVNVAATAALARALTVPVIASGGVKDLDDVRALGAAAGDGILGAITGRAVYEGTLDFAAGQRLADQY